MPIITTVKAGELDSILARRPRLSDRARELADQIRDQVTPETAIVVEPAEGEDIRRVQGYANAARKSMHDERIKVSRRGDRIVVYMKT